jgi:phosphotransferase family enzyme
MQPGVAQLAEVIAADLSTWSTPPHVELAIYGTSDARAIAAEVDGFCRRELGGTVARGLFHTASVGSVTAVELGDGRRLVLKAHHPERPLEWLQEVVRVQMHLASRGLFATTVCSGPAPIGRGLGIVEALVEGGEARDGHDAAVRAALAGSLAQIVAACRPLVAASTLKPQLLGAAPDALWPTPHSKLFDFEATAAGAEWIDEVAWAARARMRPVGDVVVGHGDWRVEHVRFAGDRVVAAFDWDSLCKQSEPALVGFTAHAFCADWSREGYASAPTLEEARAFIADYEAARGRAFSAEERRSVGAAFAYSCAYTARCTWALGLDERAEPGTFHHLVASNGPTLMEP